MGVNSGRDFSGGQIETVIRVNLMFVVGVGLVFGSKNMRFHIISLFQYSLDTPKLTPTQIHCMMTWVKKMLIMMLYATPVKGRVFGKFV